MSTGYIAKIEKLIAALLPFADFGQKYGRDFPEIASPQHRLAAISDAEITLGHCRAALDAVKIARIPIKPDKRQRLPMRRASIAALRMIASCEPPEWRSDSQWTSGTRHNTIRIMERLRGRGLVKHSRETLKDAPYVVSAYTLTALGRRAASKLGAE